MPTAEQHPTTCSCSIDLARISAATPFAAAAARYRALAVEAEIQALIAIRTNPEIVARTEALFRSLIVNQAKHQRHARRLERAMTDVEAAQ